MNIFSDNKTSLGFSEKEDFSMKGNLENKKKFLAKNSLSDVFVVTASLMHESRVVEVAKVSQDQIIDNCDALITKQKGVALTVTAADCLALYFYDPVKEIIGIAHAGWRGVLKNIAAEVINSFVYDHQSNPQDIVVYFSPHIKVCHFEVADDLVCEFDAKYIEKRDGRTFINLEAVVKNQLLQQGVESGNIKIDSECTYCEESKYFSYRRDRKNLSDMETMLAYIVLKK